MLAEVAADADRRRHNMKSSRVLPVLAVLGMSGLAVLSGSQVSHAHPHVWITSKSDLVFNESGNVAAINVEWTFDEYYSVTAIEGLDTNKNGSVEPDELRGLTTQNITDLKPYRYFTQVEIDKKPAKYGDVTEFGSYFKNGALTMFFRLPLAEPADPTSSKLEYRMYDPEFYISIEYPAKGGVTMIGKAPADCSAKVLPSEADAEEAGGNSEEFWAKLSENGDVGALYAERVTVVCGPENQS